MSAKLSPGPEADLADLLESGRGGHPDENEDHPQVDDVAPEAALVPHSEVPGAGENPLAEVALARADSAVVLQRDGRRHEKAKGEGEGREKMADAEGEQDGEGTRSDRARVHKTLPQLEERRLPPGD